MKEGDLLDKFVTFILSEKLFLKVMLACIVSLIVGILVPYSVSVWLGISNTPTPSVYRDWVDKVGFIAAFLGSLISTLVLSLWIKNANEK
ncbi:hypothetical protein COT86_00690 [Candidatus Collierbacteria bacterium CG10_big_fil_rev_8_21_14_0_10_43_36]|uniref:Uncharacterized protein n=3 Tax=Candidatus Collieribacteriota TaxID=1752725 RepID=A0A2H0DTB0_9BACT|nr:hypothetical protein [Candidatus Parcubacteria bacterium]PIP85354.1 MAG: hypothetical protein COW83_04745 [Candidatus Collierbacteria bacterium CG22_combo_CG10-13_8_21_14_all_43_12]PIS00050.1 MAG: hypothetical protein COT86_00690 [Candidatus Collierbacteria bacterium CG10_big_fil_rev_8_21_14_0_10_43_36]PIZ24279.1 MAG: hypothetical protein COY48_03860 [Candidatus Collierbacteria bacterium CG_4_10_14_0_8_um_filter_43_86]PJB48788.1 MAG: hypothetical protein CO104_00575 [Candidatus Collierbacter